MTTSSRRYARKIGVEVSQMTRVTINGKRIKIVRQ